MSTPLLLACLWVIAASAVALLPMRVQILPGALLLLAAGPLLWQIGGAHGGLATLAGGLAVASMFRHPLRALVRRAEG
ncbi:DUF2484 family protein [Rhodobacter sp. CZR27]|uniref:DUF2484 family protein n=1 Tax=Rhodobacter sp. CZR27 TaxID=2033869 RepID=UPI000BBEEC3B|nr:DUF2484 family protein [Rhodobacter sp. CZR27]